MNYKCDNNQLPIVSSAASRRTVHQTAIVVSHSCFSAENTFPSLENYFYQLAASNIAQTEIHEVPYSRRVSSAYSASRWNSGEISKYLQKPSFNSQTLPLWGSSSAMYRRARRLLQRHGHSEMSKRGGGREWPRGEAAHRNTGIATPCAPLTVSAKTPTVKPLILIEPFFLIKSEKQNNSLYSI